MLTSEFKSRVLYGVSLLWLGLSACGLPSDAEFRNAVPDKQSVTINAPGSSTALVLGAQSDYYQFTYGVTVGVNGTIVGLLDLVGAVMALPPTTRTDNERIWGPGSGNPLDPLVYKLTVEKAGSGKFTWSLDARKKTDPDVATSYLALLSGSADVSSGVNKGKGTMDIPTANWATLSGDTCGAGDISAAYDTTVQPETLNVTFTAFHPGCKDTTSTTASSLTATYVFARATDGSGNFQFKTNGTLPNSSTPSSPYAVTFTFRSRWDATGAGRADVTITGGSDLDAALAPACSGCTAITASECWDASFALTFGIMYPAFDASFAVGTVAACGAGFQTADYASGV